MSLKHMSVLLVLSLSCISSIADMAVAEERLGPELIVNGDFESNGDPYPGWRLAAITQSPIINVGGAHGNVLEAQQEGNNETGWVARYGGSQTVTVTEGATYKLEVDRYTVAAPLHFTGIVVYDVNLVSADPKVWWRKIWRKDLDGDHAYMHPPDNEWVHHTIYVQAIGATITINSWGVHASTVRIDNVSLKEVLKVEADTVTDDTAVSIPAGTGEWPAWIDDHKIRGAFDFEHVDDRDHLAKLAANGFNTVLLSFALLDVDAPQEIALLKKQAGWCDELGLHMFVITRLCGDKPETRHLVPGGRSYVNSNGFALTKTPCPVDPVFWEKVVTTRAQLVAKHSLTHRIDGFVLDPEMYASDFGEFAGYCYCEYCFREFLKHRSLSAEIPGPGARVIWLQQHGLAEAYSVWQAEQVEARARSTEQAVHELNPSFVLGVLHMDRNRWFYNAWARGFGTVKMPVIAFSEMTYESGATKYLLRARERFQQIKAHAVLCPGLQLRIIPAEEVAGQFFYMAQDSIGYWAFTTLGLRLKPLEPNTPYSAATTYSLYSPHDRYLEAFSLAGQELDRQKQEGGEFTPKLKLVRRQEPSMAPMLDDGLLSFVGLYPLDPKGQTVRPDQEPTKLRYEATFYMLVVNAGETISAVLNTYDEGIKDMTPQYTLISPGGTVVAKGALSFGSPVSLNMEATETGLYKLVLITKANLFSVALNMPHAVQSVNHTVSVVTHTLKMYFYVPEDCTEFFIKVGTPYVAEQARVIVWDPTGKEAANAQTTELIPAHAAVTTTPEQRGRAWSFQILPADHGVFYSGNLIWDRRLPPYLAESPEALLLPVTEEPADEEGR